MLQSFFSCAYQFSIRCSPIRGIAMCLGRVNELDASIIFHCTLDGKTFQSAPPPLSFCQLNPYGVYWNMGKILGRKKGGFGRFEGSKFFIVFKPANKKNSQFAFLSTYLRFTITWSPISAYLPICLPIYLSYIWGHYLIFMLPPSGVEPGFSAWTSDVLTTRLSVRLQYEAHYVQVNTASSQNPASDLAWPNYSWPRPLTKVRMRLGSRRDIVNNNSFENISPGMFITVCV